MDQNKIWTQRGHNMKVTKCGHRITAYKMLGVTRKLKYMFRRQALNQMYISYVRPLLEYSSIVWDGCSEQNQNHF